jgi:hypothetical protein
MWHAWEKWEIHSESWSENPKGREHLEDQGLDGTIILIWILKKKGGMVWIGFIRLRIGGLVAGVCEHGFHRRRGFSCLPDCQLPKKDSAPWSQSYVNLDIVSDTVQLCSIMKQLLLLLDVLTHMEPVLLYHQPLWVVFLHTMMFSVANKFLRRSCVDTKSAHTPAWRKVSLSAVGRV